MSVGRIRRILVPTDFSPSAVAALEYAVALARAFNAEVSILHVIEREALNEEVAEEPLRAAARQDGEHEAGRKVQPVVDHVRKRKVEVHWGVVEGEPVAQIVKSACEKKVDLIVMGAHGREGSPRTWLGCTIERVMRRAPCPVVAVREDHRMVCEEAVDEPCKTGGQMVPP